MRYLLFFLLALQAGTLTSMAHTYLQVICEPGVEIFLNGESAGSSNWKDGGLHLKISPDNYIVEARKAGYVSQTKEVSLRKSDVEVWSLAPFAPLPGSTEATSGEEASSMDPYGSLTVYSHPTECTITLVASPQSEASWLKKSAKWTAKKLPAGKYAVKATRQGKTLSYDIVIPAEGSVEVIFDFRKGKAHLYNVSQ